MTDALFQGLGGLGLFLLGLVVMTDALRRLAGGSLRRMLARFTRSPSSGAVTGAVTTAIVQSSSATTVTAVGFASAGLLTFPQALGIVFGANVGTTLTGWLVALVGFKLELGTAALPLVLVGVLLRLLRRGTLASAGTALAGFGLIFVGIETLQAGLAGLEGAVTPQSFPADTWGGRALLVLMGGGITLVTQSSSAGVATALAAVHAGAIALPQACALVIGMDVATTVTALVATLGASTPARRTGLAHVIYNVMTGLVAFLLLPLYIWTLAGVAPDWMTDEPELALVAFHTFFNGLGVLLVLPVAKPFGRLIERLVPDRPSPFARRLDRSLLREPHSALDAVGGTLVDLAAKVVGALEATLRGVARQESSEALELEELALADTRRYVVGIPDPPDDPFVSQRRTAALHVIDHLGRLVDRCQDAPGSQTWRADEALADAVSSLQGCATRTGSWLASPDEAPPESLLHRVWLELDEAKPGYRERVLAEAGQRGEPSGGLDRLEAMRWLRRASYHGWRIVHHLVRLRSAQFEALEDVPARAELADRD